MRVFDLRAGSSVVSLYAHHLGVTAAQIDDWKIVSGGGEGLVCVWEMRMGAKLWEMHNRWDFLSSKEKIFNLSAILKRCMCLKDVTSVLVTELLCLFLTHSG